MDDPPQDTKKPVIAEPARPRGRRDKIDQNRALQIAKSIKNAIPSAMIEAHVYEGFKKDLQLSNPGDIHVLTAARPKPDRPKSEGLLVTP